MTNKVYLVHNSGNTYDVMYSSSTLIKGFQFEISNSDDLTLTGILQPPGSECKKHNFSLSKNVIDATNNNTRVLAFTFGATPIPATTTTDLLLCQFEFSGQLNNKPTIINIEFTRQDTTGALFTDISFTHGGSILTLPNAALTTTYERHNTTRQDLDITIDAAKQWDDDHTIDISEWDNSSSAEYVDFSTAGSYNVAYSITDVFGTLTTEIVTITIEDTTKPTLSEVTLKSDNNTPFNYNSTWARVGDTVTLSFKSDEKLQSVTVTMASNGIPVDNSRISSATIINNADGTQNYSYSYDTVQEDGKGLITFTINYADLVSLTGDEVTTTGDGSTCSFDNIVPVIPVLSFSINTTDTNYDVTFEFEDAVVGFSKEDVTVAIGTGTLGGVSNETDDLTSSTDGTVWSGRFYPAEGYIVTGGELSLDCTNTATTKCIFTDLAGNPVSSSAKSHYPTVSDFVLQKTAPSGVTDITKLLKGETGTVKLVFSEPVSNFDSNHDITVGSDNNGRPYGSLEKMTSDDDEFWTGTFTPDDNLDLGTNAVDVLTLKNTYTDSDGNSGVTAKLAFILDTLAPTILSITFSNFPVQGSDKPFGAGENILINVVFSQVVILSGTASTLSLNSGGTANYSAGNNSNTIQFLYTVQSGDRADQLEVTNFNLSSGETLKDLNGNTANTSIIGVSQPLTGYEVDGVNPTMTIKAANTAGQTISPESTTNDSSIVLTFTSSEATSTFASGGIRVTNGTLSNFATSSTTVYTATFTPTADGACTIDVAGSSFTDAAGNGNNEATQFVWTCDTVNPTVTIASTTAGVTSGSTTNDASIDLTFTLGELNTTFEEGDISVPNGTLSNFAGSGDTYTATFTPTLADSDSDGNPDSNAVVCTVTVEPGTFQDAGGNNNTAASFTWTCDRRLPVVTSVTPIDDGYYNDLIYFDVIFDEPVTVSGSPTLSLTDSITATASSSISASNTVRFSHSVESDNHYTEVSIPDPAAITGGVIKDVYNNDAMRSVPEISTNIVIDKRQPVVSSVALGASSTTTNNANVVVRFSSDKSVAYYNTSSCVVVNDSLNNTSYTVTNVSATDNTSLVNWSITINTNVQDDNTQTFDNLQLRLTDKAGNNSNVATIPVFIVDKVKPIITSLLSPNNLTNNSSPEITFNSSKVGTASLTGDMLFSNNQVNIGSNKLTLQTLSDGLLSDGLYSGLKVTVEDEWGNVSSQVTIANFEVDTVHQSLTTTLSITDSSGSTLSKNHAKAGEVIQLDISSTEPFTLNSVKFIIDSIEYAATILTSNGATYSATYTVTNGSVGTANGNVGIEIVSTDAAGNEKTTTAITSGGVVVNTSTPTMEITVVGTAGNAMVTELTTNDTYIGLTFTSSEVTTDFVVGDITVSGGELSAFAGSGDTYTATFTQSGDGLYSISVNAGAFTDVAGNLNAATSVFNWTYDGTQPSMTVSSNPSNAYHNGSKSLTFLSSEDTTTFQEGDITVDGGLLSAFSGSGTTYTATFTPSAEGRCSVSVNAGHFTDAHGNTNTASNNGNALYWEHNNTPPTMTQSVPIPQVTSNKNPEYTFSSDKQVLTVTCDNNVNILSHETSLDATTGEYLHKITLNLTNEPDGLYNLSLEATDKYGNVSDGRLSMNSFTLDTTVLPIETTIKSLNASEYLAKPGDIVQLTISTQEQVELPLVTFKIRKNDDSYDTIGVVQGVDISGGVLNHHFGSKNLFIASYRIKTTTPSGLINVSINITDLVPVNPNSRTIETITTGSVLVYTDVPSLTMETPIPLHTSSSSPSFTFNASVAGLICYNGGYYGDLIYAQLGTNTIQFDALSDGTYSDLSIDISDAAGNTSDAMDIPSFTIDTSAPTITQNITTDNTHNGVSIAKRGSELTLNVTSNDDDIDFANNPPVVQFSVGTTSLTETPVYDFNTTTNKSYTATITLPNELSGQAGATSTTYNLAGLNVSTNALSSTVTVDTRNIVLDSPNIITLNNSSTPSFTFNSNKAGVLTSNLAFTSSDAAVVDSNTVVFSALENGIYSGKWVKLTDAAGNTSTEFSIPTFEIDLTPPTISSITTVLNAGLYKAGQIVPITVTFNENVKIVGTPSLIIEETSNVNATYNSGSETNELVFNYTIVAGQNFNPLQVELVSGTITDLAGNTADLTLPTSNGLSGIVIDTSAPALTEETPILSLSNNVTPSYVFTTDEAGTITSSLAFSTSTHATVGSEQTITFTTLSEGTYTGHWVKVTDEAGNEGMLTIPDFEIDTTPPDLASSSTIPTDTNNPTFTLSSNKKGTITYSPSDVIGFGQPRGATFTLLSGNCTVDGNIMRSPNYPNSYNNNDFSEVRIDVGGKLIANDFNTEFNYDFLLINPSSDTSISYYRGVGYHGDASRLSHTSTFPADGVEVAAGDIIRFDSDFSMTRTGFELLMTEINDVSITTIVDGENQDIKLVKSDGSELDQGNHTVDITVTDAAGNESSIQQAFRLDTLPPSVSTVSIARYDSQYLYAKNGDTVLFSLTSSEPLSSYQVTISAGGAILDTQTVSAASGGDASTMSASYTIAATLPAAGGVDGPLSAEYTLTDQLGNTSNLITILDSTVTIDNTPPTLTLSTHPSPYTKSPKFQVTSSKAVSLDLLSAAGEVMHQETTVNANILTEIDLSDSTNFTDGLYDDIKVKVTDHVGHEVIETLNNFIVDTTNPTIDSVSFSTSTAHSGPITRGDSITAKVYWSDINTLDTSNCNLDFKIANVRIFNNLTTVTSGSDNPGSDNPGNYLQRTMVISNDYSYTNGNITLDIELVDLANNSKTSLNVDSGVTLDTTKPILSSVAGGNVPAFTNYPMFSFHSTKDGTINCYNAGKSFSFEPATPTRDANGKYTITLSGLTDGTYDDVSLTVTDVSGNVSNQLSVNNFTVDTLDPTLFQTTITSNNDVDGRVAKAGDIITITVLSNDILTNPVLAVTSGGVDVGTINPPYADESGATKIYTYQYIVKATDNDGAIEINITAGTIQSATIYSTTVTVYTTIPVISVNDYGSTMSVNTTLELSSILYPYIEYGAEETTNNLTVEISDNININALGHYTVVYTATDAAGNSTTATRNVFVTDTLPPVLTLLNGTNLIIQTGDTFNLDDYGAQATEVTGATIPNGVVVTGSVNINVPGIYTITYSATDNTGNTGSIHRTVTVAGVDKPAISLIGDEFESYNIGDSYFEKGATCVNANVDEITIDDAEINMDVKGFYKVRYNVTSGGVAADTVVRYVAVGYGSTSSPTNPYDLSGDGVANILDVITLVNHIRGV